MSYSARVVADGAVGYWRLGDTVGPAVDSISARNGTIVGGVTLSQPGAISDPNNAMLFNGATGSVDIAHNAAFLASPFTVECWFKTTTGARCPLVSKCTSGEAFVGFSLEINPPGGPAGGAGFFNGANWIFGTFPTVGLNNGAWHHLLGRWTGTVSQLVVDGDQIGGATVGANISGTASLCIGRMDAIFAPATIDEVAYYGSALSDSVAKTHFQIGIGGHARRSHDRGRAR